MAVELIGKIKPKNNGSFAMVDAQDVEMPDGSRLTDIQPVYLSEDEYKSLEAAGKVNPKTPYHIYK